MIDYTVRYTKSYWLSIKVKNTGEVIVYCNREHSKKYVEEFVKECENEIKEMVRKQCSTHKPLSYGDKVLYLGKEYEIKRGTKKTAFDKDCVYIASEKKIATELALLYKKEAEVIIGGLIRDKAAEMNLNFEFYKITSAERIWGCCKTSSSGVGSSKLYFSWRLLSAPLDVIEYVVVHELAHIKIPNHNQEFWDFVSIYIPDYYKKHDCYESINNKVRFYCL